MLIKGIDSTKCTSCLKCVKDCPVKLFSQPTGPRASGVVFNSTSDLCIECGHCIAVCPSDAIVYDLQNDVHLQDASGRVLQKPETGDFLSFLSGKRSVRRYKDKDIPRQEIEKVLDAMRYGPTGHNAQHCHHVVIKNRKTVSDIIDKAIKMLGGIRRAIKWRHILRPFVSERIFKKLNSPAAREGIKKMVTTWQKKREDRITFNAPVLILTYAPAMGTIGNADAVIADTYGMLMADTMGLGTCWMGFIMIALEKSKKFNKQFGVPMDMNLMGAFTMGYSAAKYEAIPPRKQANVTWV